MLALLDIPEKKNRLRRAHPWDFLEMNTALIAITIYYDIEESKIGTWSHLSS